MCTSYVRTTLREKEGESKNESERERESQKKRESARARARRTNTHLSENHAAPSSRAPPAPGTASPAPLQTRVLHVVCLSAKACPASRGVAARPAPSPRGDAPRPPAQHACHPCRRLRHTGPERGAGEQTPRRRHTRLGIGRDRPARHTRRACRPPCRTGLGCGTGVPRRRAAAPLPPSRLAAAPLPASAREARRGRPRCTWTARGRAAGPSAPREALCKQTVWAWLLGAPPVAMPRPQHPGGA